MGCHCLGEGEGGTNEDSSMETYILLYVKQMASGHLLYISGNPKLVLYDNLEGCDGVEGGLEIQEGGDICIPVADSC